MSGVLIIAEQRRGELRPVSLELIGAAQSLRGSSAEVAVAVIGSAPERLCAALSEHGGGADRKQHRRMNKTHGENPCLTAAR